MNVLQTIVIPVVVPIFLLAAGYVFNGRLNHLERQSDDFRADMQRRFEAVPTRAEMNARLDRVETELASVRSDLTHIALAVGARTRPQTG